MTKHTPGPWTFMEDEIFWGEIRGPDFELIAVMPELDERSEDFRLIAAAPMMYEYIEERANNGDKKAMEILEVINVSA